MKPLGISTKVFLAFTALLAVCVGVLVYGIFQIRSIQNDTRLIHHCYVPFSHVLAETHNDLATYSALLIERDPVILRKIVQAQRVFYPFEQGIDNKLASARQPLLRGAVEAREPSARAFVTSAREDVRQLQENVAALAPVGEAFRSAVLKEDQEEASSRQQELRREIGEMQRQVKQLRQSVRKETDAAIRHADDSEREAAAWLVILSLVASAIALAIMFVLHRTLRPIRRLIEATRDLGRGELSTKVPVGRRDEVGELAEEFNLMVDKIEARDQALREHRDELKLAYDDLSSAHQRLISLRAYSENILNSVASGIVALDRDLRVTHVNRAGQRLWGLEEVALDEGSAIDALAPFDAVSGLRERLVRVLGERAAERLPAISMEAPGVTGSGSGGDAPIFDLMLVPLTRLEETVGALIIGEDVTEKLRTHAELIQKERLAAIGRMSSQVTHELRNPLSSIGLNAEMLQEEIEGMGAEPDSEAVDLLSSIMAEVDRLTEITEEYLAYARLPQVKPATTELNPLLSDLLRFLKGEGVQRGVKYHVELAESLPAVLVDPNQLRRAVLNIIRNALEAMVDGGTLTVTTKPEPPDRVLVEIGDSGPGISANDLARIFTPFFSTKPSGTGLGLPLTSQIIEEHGGRLLVSSTMGQGTVFRILLPQAVRFVRAPSVEVLA